MRTTKFFSVASISLALALTISCSSDDDSKNNNGKLFSCRWGWSECIDDENGCHVVNYAFSKNAGGVCSEALLADLEEQGISIREHEKDCYGGDGSKEKSIAFFSNEACPSGYAQECKYEGFFTIYYYGEKFKDTKCKKTLNFDED